MKTKELFLLGLLFSVLFLVSSCKEEKPLPFLSPAPIASFNFLNQDSLSITNQTFKGKVYIADFFFTSCTSICPTMHRKLKVFFDEYKDEPNLMFLSHTIDYKYDIPSKLKKYAEKLGVDGPKWQFAYGTKDAIYNIAEKSYLSAVIENQNEKEKYIHQGWFLLIDGNGRMRGAYDSTNDDQIELLQKDLKNLLAETKTK
ncbi:SCO family protein [Pedobacter sp. JCM 36344]|uniref:SCO family protein n=1 Tax=Pedobacter sp. JCM 36344 TaxID=3374280 RepID=UPI00397D1CA7